MKYQIFTIAIITSLISCGPSSEEIAREEQKKQLTQLAIVAAEKKPIVQQKIQEMKNLRIEAIAALEVAKMNVSKAKEFQLLRTESEKAAQVADAVKNVLKLEEGIKEVDIKLGELTKQLSALEEVIRSAKN